MFTDSLPQRSPTPHLSNLHNYIRPLRSIQSPCPCVWTARSQAAYRGPLRKPINLLNETTTRCMAHQFKVMRTLQETSSFLERWPYTHWPRRFSCLICSGVIHRVFSKCLVFDLHISSSICLSFSPSSRKHSNWCNVFLFLAREWESYRATHFVNSTKLADRYCIKL